MGVTIASTPRKSPISVTRQIKKKAPKAAPDWVYSVGVKNSTMKITANTKG
jgi:hypothetical protein